MADSVIGHDPASHFVRSLGCWSTHGLASLLRKRVAPQEHCEQTGAYKRYHSSSVKGAQTIPKTRLPWVLAAVVAVCLIAAGSIWLVASARRSAPIRSLAVLPLDNLSGDSSQEYLADGMTDELITELARIPNLRVVSRTSVMAEKGSRRPLPEIARR